MDRQHNVLERARDLRALRDSSVERLRDLYATQDRRQCEVLRLTATELLEMYSSRKTSPAAALAAYAARIRRIGARLGALAETCFHIEPALSVTSAGPSDTLPFKFPHGILAGIPISVKEEYIVTGTVSTCGLAWKAGDRPSGAHGALVALLVQQGALPIVRSNVPQLLMSSESDSFWGRAVNPWDAHRMPGGSSGGEGALLASQCSPLGIGTDIAGSVRIPALACGLVAFRPTPERVTCMGLASIGRPHTRAEEVEAGHSDSTGGEATCSGAPRDESEGFAVLAADDEAEGQNLVSGAPGPMARCVDDLALVMRCWLPDFSVRAPDGGRAVGLWDADPTVPHMPWDMDIYLGLSKPRYCPLGQPLPTRAPPAQAAAAWAGAPVQLSQPLSAHAPSFPPGPHEDPHTHSQQAPGVHYYNARHLHSHPPMGSAHAQAHGAPRSSIDGGVQLRVGYYTTDGWFEPAPACERAVHEAAAALQEAGHGVIPWDPRHHGVDLPRAALAYGVLVGADAIQEMRAALHGEAPNPLYRRFLALGRIPDAFGIRSAVAALFRAAGLHRWGDIIMATRRRSLLDAWEWHRQRETAKTALLRGMTAAGIDVLLSPGLGTPAWRHGQVDDLEWATSYAWLWNYLHLPAGVVPVTTVAPDEQRYYDDSELPAYQRDGIAAAAREALRDSTGLPVGVHLSGLRDEVVLRAMRELEGSLRRLREEGEAEARARRGSAGGGEAETTGGDDADAAGGRWDPRRGCPEARVRAAVATAQALGLTESASTGFVAKGGYRARVTMLVDGWFPLAVALTRGLAKSVGQACGCGRSHNPSQLQAHRQGGAAPTGRDHDS